VWNTAKIWRGMLPDLNIFKIEGACYFTAHVQPRIHQCIYSPFDLKISEMSTAITSHADVFVMDYKSCF
jgi:hypothetical protein